MATRKDVAKLAGVSVATVSNVFIGKKIVSPELTKQVMDAAQQLNYSPNYIARCLSLGKSHILGIVLTDYTNPFHMEIIRGIESCARKYGYAVATFLHENCDDHEVIRPGGIQVDALMNFTVNLVSQEFLNSLMTKHTVLVDFGADNGLSFKYDHSASMERAFQRLKELGHQKIAFVSTIDKNRFCLDSRGVLYAQLCKKYGFPYDENLIIYSQDMSFKSEELGYRAAAEFLARDTGATAVFVMNDMAAFGFNRGLHERGVSVPDDVSVIGFDGVNIMRYASPGISTISLDKVTFGAEMARLTIECIEGGKKGIGEEYVFQSTFEERESVAKAKG